MSNRTYSRSNFVAALRSDRATPSEIREERLRVGAGRSLSTGIALSAWRGRSARRYVVGVHDLASVDAGDLADAVTLAVSRDAAGLAHIVRATADIDPTGVAIWLDSVRRAGATEIHTHRLATTTAERTAVVVDLTAGHHVAGLAA